jgi:hypothetical protein
MNNIYLVIEFLDELIFGVGETAWPFLRDDLRLTWDSSPTFPLSRSLTVKRIPFDFCAPLPWWHCLFLLSFSSSLVLFSSFYL